MEVSIRILISLEVNGQLQAPAVLPPGGKPLVPTEQEDGWDPEPALTFVKEKISFSLPISELR
jgi:hypothetical protein